MNKNHLRNIVLLIFMAMFATNTKAHAECFSVSLIKAFKDLQFKPMRYRAIVHLAHQHHIGLCQGVNHVAI